ncbi:hypothetical protein ERJ75_001774400 [Trypanosoma vivax]|nr:hypothetical protein ERJ75_001774400 [Trypanosoma vivax]
MRTSDAAEGALAPATRSCVGARSLRAHPAKHGQPRYGERDHRTPASACEKALWQLAESVAERVAKGRVLEAERWPPEQARRAAAGRTGTAGKQQRRHQRDRKAWAGVAGLRISKETGQDRTRRKGGGARASALRTLRRDTARGERQEEPQQREQRTLLPDCLGERDEANAAEGQWCVARNLRHPWLR